MKARIITIENHKHSEEAAARCLLSCEKHNVQASYFPAITPEDDPEKIFKGCGIPMRGFEQSSKWSRRLPVLSCFLSHLGCWMEAVETNQTILILEHDAVVVAPIPDIQGDIVNLGKPSFGRFQTPNKGLGPLRSHRFFKGAHGYLVSPEGGKRLVSEAARSACPADLFLSKERFPDIQEFYPWPVECKDSVSTVQKEVGCRAKHSDVTPV